MNPVACSSRLLAGALAALAVTCAHGQAGPAADPPAAHEASPAASAPASAPSGVAVVVLPGRPADDLNDAFVAHVRRLPGAPRGAADAVAAALAEARRDGFAEGFVADALALVYRDYAAALEAFDAGDLPAAQQRFGVLAGSADPYLAATSLYFLSRTLIERGLYEEAAAALEGLSDPAREIAAHTPYAAHLWFLRGYALAASLEYEQAAQMLVQVRQVFGDAPAAVRIGAQQLALEVERRERGTLDEVGTLMRYAAGRLAAEDAAARTQRRQDEALALLDRLIKEREEQERQARQSSGGRGRSGQPRRAAAQPRQESVAPAGGGEVGELHAAPRADPGEMWGKLPPAERERILQSLRTRFPSRYRQIVEQYYRSLAEQK